MGVLRPKLMQKVTTQENLLGLGGRSLKLLDQRCIFYREFPNDSDMSF